MILTGRFDGRGHSTVQVRGMVKKEFHRISLPVDLDDTQAVHKGIASVWARMKVAELYDRLICEQDQELAGTIKQVALEYGLASPYTAFVAVDSLTRTKGDHGTTVAVPVPVPEGVRYETTVAE